MDDHLTGGRLYGDGARSLQDALDTRRLADTLSVFTVHGTFSDDDIELIRQQSTVWISTVDADGWPDVSYKGGDVGFVEISATDELRIPSYDGNGMWRTAGNIVDDGRVALLFIDVDRPWRMRVQGRARVGGVGRPRTPCGSPGGHHREDRADLSELRSLHPSRR